MPIRTAGSRGDCLFAFARLSGEQDIAITCVPRLIATLTPDGSPPVGPAVWHDARIEVGDARSFRDVFTGATIAPQQTASGYAIPAATLFARFPVALLVTADRAGASGPPAPPDPSV